MPDVHLTIDGKEVSAPSNTTILKAAEAVGIKIPTLCAHPALKPIGACRVCLVEVESERLLQPACAFPVSEGMVVHTNSPKAREARRLILELLLANHPLDCMTCESAGSCELQDLAYEYGIKESRFAGQQYDWPIQDANPFIVRDYSKCILCRRCISACEEINGVRAIAMLGRGFDSKVGTAFDGSLQDSPCEFCGMCIAVCPTGALSPKSAIGAGRTWEGEKITTICPYCGVGCTLDVHVKENRIIGVESNWEGASNHGWTCVKGRFGWDFVGDADRLTTPLIKKDGQFVEASWDEALDLVADRFVEIAEERGPDALAFLSSAKCTNEENYLVQKLSRALIGTNNVDHCARL